MNQYQQVRPNRFQSHPYNYQKAPAHVSERIMPPVSQSSSNQQNPAADRPFKQEQLPGCAAAVSDHSQAEKGTPAQPAGEKTDSGKKECSTGLDSESKSGCPAPIQEVDVNAMLKQIRKALGVREPCRADREARRQNENVPTEERGAEKQNDEGTPAKTDLPASAVASTADAGVSPSTTPLPKQKRTASKETQDTNQTKSLQLKEDSVEEEVSHASTSVSKCKAKATPAESDLSKPSKVRVARKSHTAKAEKETSRKPVLLHSSGSISKLSSNEIYSDTKKRSVKGGPRFGIQLGVKQANNKGPQQDGDLPLSEGFHWESVPDSPSVPPPALPSPHADRLGETPSDSPARDSPVQADVAQASSSKTAGKVSVKVEPNLEEDDEDLSSKSKKRNFSMVEEGGLSDRPSCKKKKGKSRKEALDQSQMDRLLAVSLREDELSHSMQELDKSLIQARNALQAAYAEVQRLLLLKQQFTVEVNSLRAKRIEILQGMQEGYSGANPGESATNGPPAASTMPTTSFSPSLSQQQQPAGSPAPFVPLPHSAPLALPALSLKQEVAHLEVAGPATHPFLPPASQPAAESSSSARTLLPELPSARPQAQEWRDRPKTIKTEDLGKQIQASGLLEETEGEQDAGKKPEKKTKNATHVEDEGNESDSSVELVKSSNLEVIDIEESECEDSAATDAPAPPEDPQTFCYASTQTSQQCETERKFQPAVNPTKDGGHPTESVEEDEPSLGAFSSHFGPVHGLQIHDGRLYTCSGDKTARAYSLSTRECEAVFEGHTNKVNCLLVSSQPNMPIRLYTGSSDQTIRCYSIKSKKCLEQITLPDRVLCLHIAWNILYVGLASGCVISHDLKTLKELDVFECHGPRGVSCLATGQEGARRLLLVGSYDSTISVRDAKSGLLLRTLEGHTKTVLCMKVVNDLVFSGSSDTSVHAHNIHTGELVRIYKGHGHAVTAIVILGKVMVTACLDQLVRVYELQSHDRLQVYGGHSEMVMCMAVHKSVIYTGCYDGSVQAVKLNLMKNYRCWWQSCSLIFGIPEHLVQHLIRDHTNSNLQTVKCRWKECNYFFSTQQSVRQELPEHMKSHVDCDSKVQP